MNRRKGDVKGIERCGGRESTVRNQLGSQSFHLSVNDQFGDVTQDIDAAFSRCRVSLAGFSYYDF